MERMQYYNEIRILEKVKCYVAHSINVLVKNCIIKVPKSSDQVKYKSNHSAFWN